MEYDYIISDILETVTTKYILKKGISIEKREELKQFLFSIINFDDFFLVDKRKVEALRESISTNMLTTAQEKTDALGIISSLLGPGYVDGLESTLHPKFTPAVLHRNSLEIYNELLVMGYDSISYFPGDSIIGILEHPYENEWQRGFISINEDIYNHKEYEEWIDCGENKEMFFAICASNLIYNDRKWTVTEASDGRIIEFNKPKIPSAINHLDVKYKSTNTRPATIEEILHYFKYQNNGDN